MKTIKTLAILLFSLNTFSQVQTELETSINGTYLKGGYNYEFNNRFIIGGSAGYEFMSSNVDYKLNITTGYNIDDYLYFNTDFGFINWKRNDIKTNKYFFDFGFTYVTQRNILFDLKISTVDFINFGIGYKF